MKFNLATMALGLSLSVAALAATPKVGDSATYVQSETSGAQTETETVKHEVIRENADGTITLHTSIIGGQTSSESDADYAAEELAYIDDIKAFCDSMKSEGLAAKIETVKVKAGEFEACHIEYTDENANAWYSSQVPFSTLKADVKYEDQSSAQLELTEFKKN